MIARAEQWQQSSREIPLMGYPRENQPELMKISTAIIKEICKMENMTPFKAKATLKIAGDIISEEMEHDAIL
ncbi:MAG: hypothetical protein HDR28_06020 [Lachnospiraceae bacterium]|nr:hypothetical protein [Lachnospiraceae bacterium]